MPPPLKSPVITRNAVPASADTQPLTVDASEELPSPAVEPKARALEKPEIVAALKTMATEPLFKKNADGSITITLEHPVDASFFGMAGVSTVNAVTLQRAVWKRRRAAARRYPANPTPLDQDTALIAELSGLPEPVLDELDGRDMSVIQMALGELLYSPRMLSGS